MANGQQTGMQRYEEPKAGMVVRDEGLAGREMVRAAEVQAAASAALVKAEVNARFELALLRPRNWMDVRSSLLAACERPFFADAAIFSVKRGSKKNEKTGRWEDNMVEGASIRFIEEAIRCMRNVMPEVKVLVEDDAKRIVRVTMTDLENNITMSEEFVIAKVIERKKPRDGDEVVGERENSVGDRVFRVVATDDEMTTKQAAMVSKAIRNLGKRLLPGDIHDECMERCNAVIDAKDKTDPKAARKRAIDAFAGFGVTAAMLEQYLGGPVLMVHTEKFKPLKGMLEAMREGASWAEVSGAVDADGVVAPKASQVDRLKGAQAQQPAQQAPASTPAPETAPQSPMEQELAGPPPAQRAPVQPAAPAQVPQAQRPANARRGVPAQAQQPAQPPPQRLEAEHDDPPPENAPRMREPGED